MDHFHSLASSPHIMGPLFLFPDPGGIHRKTNIHRGLSLRIGNTQHIYWYIHSMYTLLNKHGFYQSETKGTFGGYKPGKIYGRLDCANALMWIKKGYYVKHRVFFATESLITMKRNWWSLCSGISTG
jgi:hypothetical protein